MASRAEIGSITEVFNINNNLKHSLSKSEKFPDIISSSECVLDGKKTIFMEPEIHIKRTNQRISYEKYKAEGMKTVNYIATRQREKHY